MNSDDLRMAERQPNRYRGELRAVRNGGHRWVGRCRGCNAAVRVDGTAMEDVKGDTLVLGSDGIAYTTRVINGPESINYVHACGRWVLLRRVYDGGKPDSKRHNCSARCTAATGPACDCRCRGANHGSG